MIRGDTPTGHVLRGDGNMIFQLRVSSHVVLENLNVLGEVEIIPLQDAWDHRFDYMIEGDSTVYQRLDPSLTPQEIENSTLSDLTGLKIFRPSYYSTIGLLVQSSRYVTIRNCRVGYAPGTGLRVQSSDFVTIENNIVHNSSRRSSQGNHGIVIHSVTNEVFGETINDEGYRIKIIGNTVYENYNEVYSWSELETFVATRIDEGKGITVQKTDSTFDNGSGRILIANNVAYSNGFSGVHTSYSTKVDIYFNTVIENSFSGSILNEGDDDYYYDDDWGAGGGKIVGISVSDSTKCNVINNIAYSNNTFGGKVYSTDSSDLAGDEIVFSSNLAVGNLDIILSPSDFFMATADDLSLLPAQGYRVASTSVSVDAGDASVLDAVPLDKDGNTRDSNPDLGAYEITSTTTSSPSVTPTSSPSASPTVSAQPSQSPSTSSPIGSPTAEPTASPVSNKNTCYGILYAGSYFDYTVAQPK